MKVPSLSRRPAQVRNHRAGHSPSPKAAHAATYRRPALASALSVAMAVGIMAGSSAGIASAATTTNTLNLKVLVVGGVGGAANDPTTAAWDAALTQEGVPYTEVDASGTSGAETVGLPPLSSGATGNYNGVIIAGSPANFSAAALAPLFAYEAQFGVNQVDGYTAPFYGETIVAGGTLDGSIGTLSAAGMAALPSLAGPILFDTGTYGYSATVNAGAPFTPWLMCPSATVPAAASTALTPYDTTPVLPASCPSGDVLAGVYQHPSTDPQANVSELELNFDYNAKSIQWQVLAPSLVNWVTEGTHLGSQRNYVEMDIDDTFTPDNAWSIAVHDNDYSDADSQRMDGNDVTTSAQWSNPAQENDPGARPSGEPLTPFRLDQLFNYGGSVEYQDGELALPGSPGTPGQPATGPDPVLAQFQATDPNTGKPYADDFGWLSHTYDTPYLDVGCATQDYIEAELNQNTNDVLAAPGAVLPGGSASGVPGTGGLGLASATVPAGSTDVANAYGTYNPQVFVPGNHSGFADLAPGTPATVDPPDLDEATASATGGTLPAGTYEYAVSDQFNGSDTLSADQSQAYVTDGLQGDIAPIVVTGAGSVSLVWQAICHAANYIIYRAPVVNGVAGNWTEIGTLATPRSATLPDPGDTANDTSPASTQTVCVGPAGDPTSCGGEQELTVVDTGPSVTSPDPMTPPAAITPQDIAEPAGWTPPVVENANELPWEQNPYFIPALQAAGILTVGADGSKPYPNPADGQFGLGNTYSGATYAAGQPFLESCDATSAPCAPGTTWPGAEVAPRHPINVFYNAATNAQELDEYNTLYDSSAPGSQCHTTSVTTCSATAFDFPQVVQQVVAGMFQNMLANDPAVSYVHQTNTMGMPPYTTVWPPANYVPVAPSAATSTTPALTAQGTDGDGTLFEVLNPLIAEYDAYFNTNTPYVQLSLGGIGNVFADQTAWSNALTAGTVTASETNGAVTIDNTGATLNVPVTVPPGTTLPAGAALGSYGGDLSDYMSVTGTQTLTENLAPTITSGNSATSIVGAPFSFTVSTTGEPAPALTESGTLPAGLTFTDNGNGTATIAGTTTAGTGGSYPITITATNATSPAATQTFTLTNAEAPTITSASTATFGTGVAGTYYITTTGFPAPTLALVVPGSSPPGMTFTDNGNGAGTIAGTPTTAGTYPVSISATNASGSTSTLALTITVGSAAAPTIASLATADFTLNQNGAVAITTSGSPAPAITETGTLPAGLTFTDEGTGTALLQGTPTATGTTSFNVTASNGISPNATQTFTVVVGQAPTFTSAASTSFDAGSVGTFAVTATGYPAPSLGVVGTLPTGVTFVDDGGGTGTLAGTSSVAVGTYTFTIAAANGTATTNQSFTLSVGQAQAISFAGPSMGTVSSSAALSATGGASGNPVVFSIDSSTASGVCNVSGTNGTTLNYNGAGTCVIDANQAGNTSFSAAQQVTWSVTVVQVPAFMSGATETVAAGTGFSFTVMASGGPAPTIALAPGSSLPAGVTLTDPATSGTTSTAALAGTSSVAAGVYNFTISATNGSGTTTQAFTLTVTSAPAFTSLASTSFTVGQPPSFTVMATGTPTPTLTEAGALPSGVTFTPGTGGTATLGGSLTAASEGTFPLTFSATNGTATVKQSFTLTVVSGTLLFTSGASTTFTAGKAGQSFQVTATGTPTPTLTETGALPPGVTFAAGTTGTATLAGIPAATAKGIYPITLTATNTAGRTSQAFTLTVDQTPSFSSATAVTETAGSAFSFTVTATGYPTPALSSGTLPAGVSFSDNGNGTGSLSGTTAVTAGTDTLTVTATNAGGSTSQTITLTVKVDGVTEAVPSITSNATATATAGTAFTFTVTTSTPTPATYTTNITHSGALPAGVVFSNSGKGTATLSGTPTAASGGIYTITLTAKNTAGTTTQSFVLTISAKPTITSAGTSIATVGATYSFTVKTTGYSVPAITEAGALPAGVTFTDNGNGTATLAGTPNANSGGVYAITVSATNTLGTTTQSFTLTVRQPPVITNANSATAVHGTALTFQFKATGYPLPTLTHTGTVAGLKWTDTGSGTATLSGTPKTAGTYTLTITATNNNGSATQTFTLSVS